MRLTDHVATVLARREKPESPLRITQAGHPALRAPMRRFRGQLPTSQLLDLVTAMAITMRDAPGVGIAAPQVGIPLKLFLIEDAYAPEEWDPADPLERRAVSLRAMVNPSYEILPDDTVYAWEGCLSVDGWQSIVPRGRRIRLRGQEIFADGSLHEVDEEHVGWTARIYQHEIDHLSGVLCHDRSVPRSFVESRYTMKYEDMSEAAATLGLSGDITYLAPGEVRLRTDATTR